MARKQSHRANRRVKHLLPFETLEDRRLMAATNPSVIDLYMGYTAAARQAVGSQQAMNEKINRSVASLNQALANSKVRITARLVGTMETNYAETGNSSTDIARLTVVGDGQLDDVSSAAAAAGADITSLVLNTSDNGGVTQLSSIVVKLENLNSGVLNHEFGHALGAGHAHGLNGAGDGTQSTPYAFEGINDFGGTKLGGALVGHLPYYSNPSVSFRGKPTGVAGTGIDAADNARVMNENAVGVSNNRAPTVVDSTGPAAQLGTVWSPVGQNVLRFNVRYADGSGVNADSFGNDDVFVNGPNGFVASANLVSVSDNSVNYGYNVATYEVALPGAVGDLNAYTFGIRAGAVTDTKANGVGGGVLTSASSPMLPLLADSAAWTASEEGDVTNKSLVFSGEAGGKYSMGFNSPAIYHVTLSATNNLSLTSSNPGQNFPLVFRDANNNLQLTQDEMLAPTGVGQWANLTAGDNYYIYVGSNGGFGDFKMFAKFDNPQAQVPPTITPSTLSGFVWTDINRNGRLDDGEPGVPNVPMTLTGKNDIGQNVNTVINTDANGNFTFGDLRPADATGYTITRTPPPGRAPTFTIPGSLSGSVESPDVVSRIFIVSGSTATGYRFGLAPTAALTTLAGSVYMDLNNNGIREAGEAGIANASVTVTGKDAAANAVNTTVVTNGNGDYLFNNLAASDAFGYALTLTQPNGVLVGKNTVGSLGGTLTANAPNGIFQIPVNGTAGTGYLFGEQPLPANPPPPPDNPGGSNTTGQNTGTNGNVNNPTQIVPIFDFANGFANAGGQFATNGNASLAGQALQVTPNAAGQAGSIYYNQKVNVTRFNTQFNFTMTPGSFTADGMTFIIQGNGTNALGGAGGALGSWQIDKSVAIKFDLWDNQGEGNTSTGMFLNGAFPTVPGSIDLRPNGFDFHNGNTIQVNMVYDGTTLSVTLKDPTTNATATQNYAVNIPATVGGNTAYIGFTGGTGGATAAQQVNGWTYNAPVAAAPLARTAGIDPSERTPSPVLYASLIPNSGPYHAEKFTLNRDGSYEYVPKQNYYGTDSFKYQVVDQNGRIAIATMNLVVNHVVQPAMENEETPHTYSVNQKGTIDVDMTCELEDAQDRGMTFKLGKVKGGTAKILADGHTLRFTAAADFRGLATIDYLCSNGLAVSGMQLCINVMPTAKKPTANDDCESTKPSTAVSINALRNDVDPEHVHLCLLSVDDPAHGSATIDKRNSTNPADWRIVYRPDFGFHGTETFKYKMVDFYGTPAIGKITVDVTPGAGLAIDPIDASKTALDVFGTNRGDNIQLSNQNGSVRVRMNGNVLGVFNPTGVIGVFGDNGDDNIDAHGLNRTVWLFGDDGNDCLTGGDCADLLVGGKGKDNLDGANGDDRLIAGTTDHATAGFSRFASVFSNANETLAGFVHDDNAKDELTGGNGSDTFWANSAGNGTLDKLRDRTSGEKLIEM